MNVAQALLTAKHRLANTASSINKDEASIDSRVLLQHVLQCTNTYLYTYPDENLNAEQSERYSELITRRCSGEPVAYIIGYREFWGLRLAVSPATLIPRPETELLVETVLEKLESKNATVLDLGTGTGAVALALASEKPQWRIVGVDKVDAAIQLATQNKANLGIENVDFLVSDWFASVANRSFSIIVSNPPYVEKDSDYLSLGDLRFEPSSALVAESNGLSDIFTIVDNSPNYLASNGWLMIEHGHQQAESIAAYMKTQGFDLISTRYDIQKHPRVTIGRWMQ